MRLSAGALLALSRLSGLLADATPGFRGDTNNCLSEPIQQTPEKIAPKVMIISMFAPEAEVWYKHLPGSGLGDLLAVNISIPGLSPIFPQAHCTASGEICQLTAGESEINAAASLTALALSPRFDLVRTYFLAAGIAGVNPKLATLGGVALARFAVQVALQYEIDAREMPAGFATGYVPFGGYDPGDYPAILYGTEVLELNAALRDRAYALASRATLADDAGAAAHRAMYAEAPGGVFERATRPPSVGRCDTATSDVYYSGALLSEAFENTTRIWTNQTAITYCMTAQEDNAVLEVLLRAHLWGLVDYERAIVMRAGSNFDRPPPSVTAYTHLRLSDQDAFDIAVENLYRAGVEIVRGIVDEWNCTYEAGVRPTNYVGDVFGSLGGEPDFGPGGLFGGRGACAGGGSCGGAGGAGGASAAASESMRRRRRRGGVGGGWK
ncbi:hypothetical protein DL765_000605 [Monosporascus sp. GIB2]|nr:hypothetical protein DL765_000605 [Monosporascus sp. GIB2]